MGKFNWNKPVSTTAYWLIMGALIMVSIFTLWGAAITVEMVFHGKTFEEAKQAVKWSSEEHAAIPDTVHVVIYDTVEVTVGVGNNGIDTSLVYYNIRGHIYFDLEELLNSDKVGGKK